jgi:signal transduction histidine kinase
MTKAVLENRVRRLQATNSALQKSLEQTNKRLARSRKALLEARKELKACTVELKSSADQQMVTADILRVISDSPTDVKRVFDAIIKSGMPLFGGLDLTLRLLREDELVVAASTLPTHDWLPIPLADDRYVATRCMRTRDVVQVGDVLIDGWVGEGMKQLAKRWGFRAAMAAPLIRDGAAIGVIAVIRAMPGLFSGKEIALLRTFADQAVIAIENTRVFNETKEALEQQTATAEILRVISSSPTDLQPVFDAILENATRLCDAHMAVLRLHDGERFHRVAQRGFTPEFAHWILTESDKYAAHPESVSRQMIAAKRPIHILDHRESAVYRNGDPSVVALVELGGVRTALGVPMQKEGRLVGAIMVNRREVRAFTQKQIDLVSTFADQAVIAIENVRLFNETKEALEQQTGTAEILRVISESPTDTQPVFDAIVNSAVRLFGGLGVTLRLVKGDQTEAVATTIPGANFTIALSDDGYAVSRSVLRREIVHVPDVLVEAWVKEESKRRSVVRGRAILCAPLLREDQAIGAILVNRANPGPFSEKQIALLQTFAAQAVIAIENVRLFKELQARNAEITEALEQQTVVSGILRVISSSPLDVQPVFDAIVQSGIHLFGGMNMSLRLVKGDQIMTVASTILRGADDEFATPLNDDRFPSSRAVLRQKVIQTPDMLAEEGLPVKARERAKQRGYRAIMAAPLMRESKVVGAITVNRATPGPFTDKQVALLNTFADQAVIAIENVRLFNEIQDKSRQLEIANRHKSEFLANMSHELRTPLNAVIGFSEVLQQGMVGELNAKQGEYIEYIHKSGSHLLSLINDILDLSKVEAGRMELDLASFSVPMAIDNALTLVKERATRHGLTLECTLDPAVADIHADERKFKQVMLNLLSNAVKFTPEGGRITVAARAVNDAVEVSVTDTGVGIAPEDCDAVFEEFRQVGQSADAKAQGTGLGLALTRKFIELHGGRIWLTSALGKGSTFSFALPITQPEAQAAS